jgi:hypothetical protein
MLEPVFTPEQLKMLDTPLRPDEIEHKQGLSYLKGQFAVVKANRIFGIGNWAYKQLGTIEITDTGIKNSKGNTIYLVSAMVELTVRGCEVFVEQGDCESQGMGAPALSMARKGAVTDGLKRCLKNFGAAFGLDLYFTSAPIPAAAPEQRQQAPTQATRPAVTQSAPQTVNRTIPAPSQPQAARPAQAVAPAPRPVTQNGSTSAPNPAPALDKATDQQREGILKIAGRRGMEEIELNSRLREIYGYGLSELTKSDAGHFIKVLQEQA